MRITIVTGFFLPVPPLRGGATERSWHGLAKVFAERGHKVTLLSRQWEGLPDYAMSEGVEHIRLRGFDHRRRLAANLALDLIWGFRVMGSLPASDITICNTVALPFLLGLFRRRHGKVAVMIGRTPKGQVRFYSSVSRIYLPSSAMLAQVGEVWAQSRAMVIGYPIDWHLLSKAANRSRGVVQIGFVGRLHPEKGVSLLLAAASLLAREEGLPEWRLSIAGPESVREGGGGEAWVDQLRRDSVQSLGTKVQWLGPEFDPARLADLYGSLDIFCYPSLATNGETFGVGIAEAMAAGCTVIVSKLACFGDLVSDGETGLVFEHSGPTPEVALMRCLRRLVSEGELRRQMAARGQAHARRFDYAEISQNILTDLALLTGTGAKNP